MRLRRLLAQPALAVGLVGLVVALEPLDMAVAFERQEMGSDEVQEPTVVADNHRAAGEQHGRASCGERVCKNVYVSVVAVQLKKKTTNQNITAHSHKNCKKNII